MKKARKAKWMQVPQSLRLTRVLVIGAWSLVISSLHAFVISLFAFTSFLNSASAEEWPLREINEAKAKSRGLRTIEGKHLILMTDIKSAPEIEELPAVFDAAVPQWCERFGIDPKEVSEWRVRGFLMNDRKTFEAAEVLPEDLPEVTNGYTFNHECFLNNQPSAYYQRHLLIHEGTHAFQFAILKPTAEQWYSEGIAEFFGTHVWKNGKLEVGVYPKSRADFLQWGRIELLEQAHAEGKILNFAAIRAFKPKAFAKNESYAWTWSIIAMLDNHPRYQERFRKMLKNLREKKLSEELTKTFGTDGPLIVQDAMIFARDAVYGYDFTRTVVDFTAGTPINSPTKCAVAADRGWQNSRVQIEAGKTYKFMASGKAELANITVPWISEPNGITIRYHHGKPLGLLLAAIGGEQPKKPDTENGEKKTDSKNRLAKSFVQFNEPEEIGIGTSFIAPRSGTLFFKINDSAAELGDNRGGYEVMVESVP